MADQREPQYNIKTPHATPASHATRIADGAVIAVDRSRQKVRLQLVSPKIVHVTVAPDGNFNLPASLMAIKTGGDGTFSLDESGDEVVLKTSALETHVSTKDGAVRFTDAQGKPILLSEGVLFLTYATLRSDDRGEKLSRAAMIRIQVSWNTSSTSDARRMPMRRRTKRSRALSCRA